MNIEEAKKICRKMLLYEESQLLDYEAIAIETVLNELELKGKVIDEMAEFMGKIITNTNAVDTFCDLPGQVEIKNIFRTKETIKEYFTKVSHNRHF